VFIGWWWAWASVTRFSGVAVSVAEKGVQRAADVFLHLVEVGAKDGVDPRGAGVPQPEGDLAGSDEVIELGEAAGRQRPVPRVAVDQRRCTSRFMMP